MRPIGGGDNPASFPLTIATNAPGSLTATPGIAPLETGRVKHSCGTSNATALASRCAALAYEQLIALDLPEDSEAVERPLRGGDPQGDSRPQRILGRRERDSR